MATNNADNRSGLRLGRLRRDMRAFFQIASVIGTGTDADPYRPAHTDTLTGWAACYKGATEALVLVETPDPATFAKLANVSFVGLFADVQADVAGLQGKVEATLNANTGGALTTKSSQAYCVCDYLKIDLAGANAADSVTIRVYVEGE